MKGNVMHKKGLLIDLDGTLVNTLPDRIKAVQYALNCLALPEICADNVRHYIGNGADLLAKRTLQESLQDNPARITSTLINDFVQLYEDYYLAHICEQTELCAGVIEFLDILHSKNIPMAVITNKLNSLTHALLQSLGIAHYFNAVLAGNDGEHKPSADLLMKALDNLGIHANEALMIGDSIDDYHAAQTAQIEMIAVSTGYRALTLGEVPIIIDNVTEALPYFMKKLSPIMFVGTGSDVGKSIITTAFCRIFKQDGYQPAPFKAQNMSNYSVILENDDEMAIAQVTQAESAQIPANPDMNPILVKPMADHTSRVIVLGKSLGQKNAYEYFRGAGVNHLKEIAHQAYDRLARQYSPMVLEGAGSISELNLKDRDMANLSMGMYAGANIILVTDIERGGIFASLYGSIMLLPETERSYIKGIIINKFRGDLAFFQSGIEMIEELCKVPVLGVIPYYQNIEIAEEDSLSSNSTEQSAQKHDLDYKNQQYDKLADHVREYVQIDKIYALLNQ